MASSVRNTILVIICTLVTFANASIDLAGMYQTTFDVSSWINLALDVRDMKSSSNDLQTVKNIYNNGRNAKFIESNGNEAVLSLASLSRDSYDVLRHDPLFGYFVYTYSKLGAKQGEKAGQFEGGPVHQYADTLVNDLFDIPKADSAITAMVVLNVWMFVIHQLYDFLRACRDNNHSAMHKAIDIAAALWIGADQQKGDPSSGHLLYNLAENAQLHFEHHDAHSEAIANKEFLKMLTALQTMTEAGACAKEDGYLEYRRTVRRTIGYAALPLVQALVHEVMQTEDKATAEDVALYSLGLAPMLAVCDPVAFDSFYTIFVKEEFKAANKPGAVKLLQYVYSCLEVTCADVGGYKKAGLPDCVDPDKTQPPMIVGYQSHTTEVQARLKFDRDILQIRALMSVDLNDAALEIYKHGYNAHDTEEHWTLRELATSDNRASATAEYEAFHLYFNEDPNYADSLILKTLQDKKLSQTMRTELVVGIIQNLIMYMAILESANLALDKCKEQDVDASLKFVDYAVAYYAGSVESVYEGGVETAELLGVPDILDHGQMLYTRSKELCKAFSSCQKDDKGHNTNSVGNVEIIVAFKDFANQLNDMDCDNARTTFDSRIAPLLMIPLVQGTLFYAFEASKRHPKAPNKDLATAYAFAESILPYLVIVDESATEIGTKLSYDRPRAPPRKDVARVFELVSSSGRKLGHPDLLLQCDALGYFGQDDFASVCDRPPETEYPTETPTKRPTDPPTPEPTKRPTRAPTPHPTKAPTRAPTEYPTPRPTKYPTPNPTPYPTADPTTAAPTTAPSVYKPDWEINLTVPKIMVFTVGSALVLVFSLCCCCMLLLFQRGGNNRRRYPYQHQPQLRRPYRGDYQRLNRNVI